MLLRRFLACLTIPVLCSITWLVTCQTDQCAEAYASSPNIQGLVSAPLPNNTCACTYQDSSQEKTPHWYASSEWWLVIVAIPTLILIWYQARETARSAKAAQDGIELMMSKERARLRIEMEDLDLVPTDGAYEVKFKVRISGPTPAFIVDTKCAAFIGPKQIMADEETADRLMRPLYSFPSVIEPGRDVDAYAFLGFVVEDGMDLEIQAVKNGELFVGMRGIITYTDVFERKRSTAFRYFCDYSEIPGLANGWTKCGQPDENQAT
jgi:hypothetical protein